MSSGQPKPEGYHEDASPPKGVLESLDEHQGHTKQASLCNYVEQSDGNRAREFAIKAFIKDGRT